MRTNFVYLWSLGHLGLIALFFLARFFVFELILIGVPCWFMGRYIVMKRRKKALAEGNPPPRAPSNLRRVVQAIVSLAALAIWGFVLFLVISWWPQMYQRII